MDAIPMSNLLATATSARVSLRDTGAWDVPEISSIERSPDEISKSGPLTWIKFVSPHLLAFGTSSGVVFLSPVDDIKKLGPPIEVRISKVILSSFSCYGHLGLCTSNGEVLLLSNSGSITFSIKLAEGPISLRCAAFCPPFLSCVVDDHPCFVTIDETSQIIKHELPMIKNVPINGTSMTSFSPNGKFLAVAKHDGSVLVINTGYRKQKPHQMSSPESPDFITFLTWSPDSTVLNVWRESGVVQSWFVIGETLSTTKIDLMKAAMCIVSDHRHLRIYVSTADSLHAIEMMKNSNRFCVSSSQVLDTTVGGSIFNDKTDLWPLKMVAVDCVTNWLLVVGESGFVLVDSQGNKSEKVHCSVQHAGFLGRFIVIAKDNSLQFYTFALKLVHERELTVTPTNMAVGKERMRMILSNKRMIVHLRIADTPRFKKREFTRLGCYYLYVDNIKPEGQIHNAIPWDTRDMLIHYVFEDAVRSYRDPALKICENVDRMWILPTVPTAFFQCGRYVTIRVGDKMVKIQAAPYHANPYEIMYLAPELTFGGTQIGYRPYGYFFLLQALNQQRQFDLLFGFYSQMKQWPQILVDTSVYSFSNGTAKLWVPLMPKILSDDLMAKVIGMLLKLISGIKKEVFFNYAKYEWMKYLPLMSEDQRIWTVLCLPPKDFLEVYEIESCEYDKKEFVKLALSEHEFMKGFLVSVSIGVNVCEFLESESVENDMSTCVGFFETEMAKWGVIPMAKENFVFLGSSLHSGSYSFLALALFLVLGDKAKLSAILSMEENLVEVFAAYADECPRGKYREIISDVLKEVEENV